MEKSKILTPQIKYRQLFLLGVILIITLIFGISSVKATSWNAALNNGLVVYYTLDVNGTDATGTKTLTAYHSPAIKTGSDCLIGSCYYFNSSNFFTNASGQDTTGFPAGQPMTIAMWFRVNDTSATSRISLGFGTPTHYFRFMQYQTTIRGGMSGAEATTGANATWYNNGWHFFLSMQNATGNYLWIDNTYQAISGGYTISVGGIGLGGSNGAYDGGGVNYIGYLDEVGIWNRSLSPTEQTQLYNSGTGISYSQFSSDSSYPQFTNVLVNPSSQNEYIAGQTYYFNSTIANTNQTIYFTFNNVKYYPSNISNNYYVNLSNLSIGTYIYNWSGYGNGVANLYNLTSNYNYIISNNTYPQITAVGVSPPNNTEYQSGLTWFTSHITFTNYTAYLTFNNTKYPSSSVSHDFFVSVNNILPATYIYNWTAYGNGTNHVINSTGNYYYTVNPSEVQNIYPDNNTKSVYATNPFECAADIPSWINNITLFINGVPVYTVYNTTGVQTLMYLDYNYTWTGYPWHTFNWTCLMNYGTNLVAYSPVYLFTNAGDIVNYVDDNFTGLVTDSKTFTINISYDNTRFNVAGAQLFTNLTNPSYIPLITISSGNNSIMTTTIDLPNISNTYGFQYSWNLVELNGSTSYVDGYDCNDYNGCPAKLIDINFGECNATLNIKALNFTAWNQDTLNMVKPFDFKSTLKYFLGNGTTYKATSFNNLSVNEKDICIDNPFNYKISGDVQYDSVPYQTGNYYFNRYNVDGYLQNISLYFMNTTQSTSFIILVQDISQVPQVNYYVYIYRYYPATDTSNLVQTIQTDSAGKGIGFFETETTDYSFVITDSFGNVVLTTAKRKIIPETTPYTLIFTIGKAIPSPFDYFKNLSQITYTLGWNKATKQVSYVYSDSNSTFDYSRLEVDYLNYSGGNGVICNLTNTDATGISSCDLSNNLSGSYVAQAYTIRNGIEYFVNSINFDISGFNAGMIGIFGGFLIILICSFVLVWNEVAGIIMIDLGVIGVQLLGLINFGIIGVSAVIGVSVLIVIFLERA